MGDTLLMFIIKAGPVRRFTKRLYVINWDYVKKIPKGLHLKNCLSILVDQLKIQSYEKAYLPGIEFFCL